MKIETRDNEIILSEVYSGVGIQTDKGLFGIAQRDGGIEVMLDGEIVWSSEFGEIRGDGPAPDPATWACKIGEVSRAKLPHGVYDLPMREAVAQAYELLTGTRPDFIFSGWAARLSVSERAFLDRCPPHKVDGDTDD
jgi:hypothetical protein